MTDANKIRVLVDWVKFQEQSGYPVRLWSEYHSDLCSIADRMEAMEKALRNLSERHEWSENVGPCVCEAHEVARRIFEKNSK